MYKLIPNRCFTFLKTAAISKLSQGPANTRCQLTGNFHSGDGSDPTSPALSGTPLFNDPVSMIFSTLVAGVGVDGGYFNNVASGLAGQVTVPTSTPEPSFALIGLGVSGVFLRRRLKRS